MACTSPCPTRGRRRTSAASWRGRGAAAAARAARVRGPLCGDALARAEELRAAPLRRNAGAARRRVPVEPRRAVRRDVPAQARSRAARGRRRRRARGVSDTVDALRRREFPTRDVSSRVRLTKTPERYLESRASAASCRTRRCSRAVALVERRRSRARVSYASRARARSSTSTRRTAGATDPRDYDVEHYVRVLRENFAARLARAFTPED